MTLVNPHGTRSSGRHQRFSVNVWAERVQDHLIGPYLLRDCVDGLKNLIFFQKLLPNLLQHVRANVGGILWCHHDGPTAYFFQECTKTPTYCLPKQTDRGKLLATQTSKLFLLRFFFLFSKNCRVHLRQLVLLLFNVFSLKYNL